MSEFTAGKWTMELIYGDHPIVTADGRMVADCFNNEANARLIASAPEMYNLLMECTDGLDAVGVLTLSRECNELLARINGEEWQT